MRGMGLNDRLARSSAWTTLGYGLSQAIRLASNLILTRLLFPEAFGLMALVTVFIVGLAMFSDVGLAPTIQRHARGDDPDFLNTAWTLQVLRGFGLSIACCLIAWPVAQLYGEPLLAWLLPVAGIALAIAGFNPTRIETANRHLLVGKVTVLDLLSQIIGIALTLLMTWVFRSVWALVIGSVLGSLVRLILMHVLLPGTANRFHWERAAASELVTFGKWIFCSTVCAFVLSQADKAILGKHLTLEMLGIYNIGFFIASFPLFMAAALNGRIMIPLYRERPPAHSSANFRALRRLRLGFSAVVLGMQLTLAFFGAAIIGLLYDPRFTAAGAVVVAVACVNIPYLIGMTYDTAALAAGDSRRVFYLTLCRAVLHVSLFLIGVELAGLPGALAGQALAQILAHTVIIWVARHHGAWDPWHDLFWAIVASGLAAGAFWLNRDVLLPLQSFTAP